MTIIEQAARRLEELRRSGIEVPSRDGQSSGRSIASPGVGNLPARAAERLEEARAPTVPTAPSVRERQWPAVHSVTGRKAGAGHSRLVKIDLASLNSMGFLTPETPRAQIADEFRVIKRALLTNLLGASAMPVENANLIMVTSSLADEGKTFVTINLAMSMAMELDRTVLLVDADVSRPSVLSHLGIDESVGLLDVLADPSIELSDVLLRTNVDKLTILPAGAPRGHATEMLASEAMTRLLADLRTRYSDRIIIFDAPPLLPSTESRVLATRMGQVILVVEAERTPQRTVLQALATIESCSMVMPLLNKASHSEVGFYYGYYGPVGG